MGKKRAVVIGSPEEEELKKQKAIKLEQKKLRQGQPSQKPDQPTETSEPHLEAHPEPEMQAAPSQPSAKAKPVHTRSKSYAAAKKMIDSLKTYPISDGLTLLHKTSLTSFDPTVELHIVLKKAPESKLSVTLPHPFGKSKKVVVATDDILAQIESGKMDFDLLVASPAQMGKLVKFAKVLGPKGLMPNPKNGTVAENPEVAAKKLASDQSQSLRLDKSGPVIHTAIGKLSAGDKKLEENITTVLGAVSTHLKKAVLKSTTSPAIKIQAS